MAVTNAVLGRLLKGLKIALTGPDQVLPGQKLNLRLTPSPSELKVSDLILGQAFESRFSKNVRFADDNVILGDETLNDVLDQNIIGAIPLTGLTGTPGDMGRTVGKLPLPAEVPVLVEVTWAVKRVTANPDGTETETALPAASFTALRGLTAPELDIAFHDLAALTETVLLRVYATVQLSVESASATWTLPYIPVSLLQKPYLSGLLGQITAGLETVRSSAGPILPGQPALLSLRPAAGAPALPADLPARLEQQWVVQEQNGDGTWTTLTEGTDYAAPGGLRSAGLELLFPFQSRADKAAAPRQLRAVPSVKLLTGPLASDWAELTGVPLNVITPEMLDLQILREGSGLIVPGVPVPLKLLAPGLPGAALPIGALPTGALPAGTLPVDLQVNWSVTDASDTPLTADTDFGAPHGLKGLDTALLFSWRKCGTATPAPLTYKVKATVTLRANGQSHAIELPALTLSVVSIEMLGLQILRDGSGPVMPGVPVPLKLLAPGLPTIGLPAGALPADLQVTWSVTDGNDHPLEANPATGDPAFGAPAGLNRPDTALLFFWKQCGSAASPTPLTYKVKATVTFGVNGQSESLDLTALKLSVLSLEMLGLRIVRDGLGEVLPGQAVPLTVLSPHLPLVSGLSAPLPAQGALPFPTGGPGQLEVKWTVKKKADGTVLVPGTNGFEAPEGLGFPRASFVFPWGSGGEATEYTVAAEVSLRTIGGLGDTLTLPELTIKVKTMDQLGLTIARNGLGPVVPGFPLPLEILSALPTPAANPLQGAVNALPVRIDAEWSVCRKGETTPLQAGSVFDAPNGLFLPNLALVFKWENHPQHKAEYNTYTIKAQTKLVVNGNSTNGPALSIDVDVVTLESLRVPLSHSLTGPLEPGTALDFLAKPPALPLGVSVPDLPGAGNFTALRVEQAAYAEAAATAMADDVTELLPVRIKELKVTVKNQDGNLVSDIDLTRLSPADVRLLITPPIEELTNQAPLIRTYHVVIEAELAILDKTATIPVIDLPVPMVPLRIPTVMAMFVDMRYQGACLVVVPNNSVLRDLSTVRNVMETVKEVLAKLKTIASMASFLGGLSALTTAINAANNAGLEFWVGNLRNMNDITLVQRGWLENDTEAEDEITSVILLGAPGKTVDVFEHRNYEGFKDTFETGNSIIGLYENVGTRWGDKHNDVYSSILWP